MGNRLVGKVAIVAGAAGGIAIASAADVTVESECESALAECIDTYGQINIRHNNVGIGANDTGP